MFGEFEDIGELDESYQMFFDMITEEKSEEEEEAEKLFYNPYGRRTFLFYPSYKDCYYDLKEVSIELALKYIESLMEFGVDNKDIPKDEPIIKAVLEGPQKTIEKAYTNYVLKTHKVFLEKKEEFIKAYKERAKRIVKREEE